MAVLRGGLAVLIYFYNMKILVSVIFVLICAAIKAQDSIPCYFNEQLQPVDKRKAVYTGKMTETPEGWVATAYYPNGQTLLQGVYTDKKLSVRNGPYTLYNTNGTKRFTVMFQENVLNGPYQSWHENGQTADSGLMRENIKSGLWKTWYVNGVLESEGSYAEGAMDGTWKWFRENRLPATVEVYANSKIKELNCFDTLGVNTGYTCRIDKKPCPKNEYSFESFVIENLEYPKDALKKGVEGVVNFEFMVTKDGKLTRINFTNQSDKILQDAIVLFLKSVPEWEPAISHNREVDCLYNYQVPFYLP